MIQYSQAPGPLDLKKHSPTVQAKNQPDSSKIFHWPTKLEVYGYNLSKLKSEPMRKPKK